MLPTFNPETECRRFRQQYLSHQETVFEFPESLVAAYKAVSISVFYFGISPHPFPAVRSEFEDLAAGSEAR